MRRALETLIRWLAEALLRLYYPDRTVEGAESIPGARPPDGAAGAAGRAAVARPVIFVANHPNGLLDPLLLRVATGRPARFLAKSTLFRHPLGRLAMSAFGSIPVYRAHESGGRGQDTSRNDESFARCRAALARGEALALFPEGVSHSDPQLRPLKTGASRIALSAEAEHGGALGLEIVPVGLFYEQKVLFRSRVLLVVGAPLPVAPLLQAYERDPRASVDALTDDIRARLDDVVLQAETHDLLAGIARVAQWTGDAPPTHQEEDLAARHQRTRVLLAAYGRLRARDPDRVEAIAATARAYARTLRRLGVSDPWALEVEILSPGPAALTVIKLVAALPVAITGAVLGWVPYRLAGMVAARVTTDDDVLGTVKMLAGTVFLVAGWLIEAIVVGARWGAAWGPLTFVVGVASGYVALRFQEIWRESAEAMRHLWLRAFHRDTARRLAAHRRTLADAVTAALREVA